MTSESTPAAQPAKPDLFGKGKRILIADDDPTTTELLRKMMSDVGFEVFTAANGQEAWHRLSERPLPDVMICDFLMPEMDGFSLFKEMKKNAEIKDVPIMILTARRNTQDSFLVAGVDGFHPKPINTELFLQEIKTLALRPKAAAQDTAQKPPAPGKKSDDDAE